MSPCRDCGTFTISRDRDRSEWYMVHDSIWSEAGMEPTGGCLCIGCLERRLHRVLRRADFTGAPCNDPGLFHMSPRLQMRLAC